MTLEDLFAAARNLHLDQYRGFIAKHAARGGGPEVIFQLGEHSGLYRRLYRVDYVANRDDAKTIVEMTPDRVLSIEPIAATVGDMELRIDALAWDDLAVFHDMPDVPTALDAWFDHWFDDRDTRNIPGAEFSSAIHSLNVDPGRLDIDLGTAPVAALLDLIDVFAAGGARDVRIATTRDSDPH